MEPIGSRWFGAAVTLVETGLLHALARLVPGKATRRLSRARIQQRTCIESGNIHQGGSEVAAFKCD
jgi:hypothetical protein